MLLHLELVLRKSGKRDSNSRPQPWQGCALPTELFPPEQSVKRRRLELPRLAALPPQSSASTNSATSPTILSFQEIQPSFQIAVIAIPLNCECKGTSFFHTDKTFRHFFLHLATFFFFSTKSLFVLLFYFTLIPTKAGTREKQP